MFLAIFKHTELNKKGKVFYLRHVLSSLETSKIVFFTHFFGKSLTIVTCTGIALLDLIRCNTSLSLFRKLQMIQFFVEHIRNNSKSSFIPDLGPSDFINKKLMAYRSFFFM